MSSKVNFFSNHVSHLTEMMTQLTRINSTSREVYYDQQLNSQIVHVALKAKNNSIWDHDSACARHMYGNKTLFSTSDN